MEIMDVFLDCVDKWAKEGIDARIDNALDNFENWIDNLEHEEKEILIKLLQNFDYYSKSSVDKIINKLNQETIEKYKISNTDSVISVVRKEDGKFNSSYEYWLLHRTISDFSKEIYYDSVNDIDEDEWNNVNKVVYVDDCSGTGIQFTKFLKRQKKSFANKQIVLIVIEAVNEAITYIKDELAKQGLSIEIVTYTTKEKALKNLLQKEKQIFNDMSKKQEVIKKYICGFEGAEALMSFYNNTPNDTLGLFWFPSEKNNPIFPRKLEQTPGWKLSRQEKQKRRREQYESKCV